MRYPDHDPQLQLATVPNHSSINPDRRWFKQIVMQCAQPTLRGKPDWVHLPDRVWQRNSAFLMSLHERKRVDD